MSSIEVRVDASALERLGNMIGAAGKMAPVGIARALNHTGDKARTQMVRTLTDQTGLKRKVIVKALQVNRAAQGGGAGGLVYTIRSRGGNIRLKYFGARETRAGVSAAPWGARRVYLGTFIKGGRFPNRVSLSMGGHVFRRTGLSRLPIEGGRSGLYIPKEMVTGATAGAFFQVVQRDLPPRLVHELARILGGAS